MKLRIKEVMKERGITGRELAAKLGVTPQYISNIVSGRQSLSLNSLEQFASLLGVQICALIEEELPKKVEITCPHCGKKISIRIEE